MNRGAFDAFSFCSGPRSRAMANRATSYGGSKRLHPPYDVRAEQVVNATRSASFEDRLLLRHEGGDRGPVVARSRRSPASSGSRTPAPPRRSALRRRRPTAASRPAPRSGRWRAERQSPARWPRGPTAGTTRVARPSASESSAGMVRREVEQLDRLGPADQSLQVVAGARVAGERDVGEREVEAGGVGQDAQVAGECQARAGTGRDAVDRSEDRFRHGGERGHDRVVVLVDGAEQRPRWTRCSGARCAP